MIDNYLDNKFQLLSKQIEHLLSQLDNKHDVTVDKYVRMQDDTISKRTVVEGIKSGQMVGYKRGKVWFIKASEL